MHVPGFQHPIGDLMPSGIVVLVLLFLKICSLNCEFSSDIVASGTVLRIEGTLFAFLADLKF
jgi:hypothetical protein